MAIDKLTFSESDPYMAVFLDTLTSDFCQHVIDKFENDKAKQPGWIGDGYYPSIKDSLDLAISQNSEWQEEEIVINQALHEALVLYTGYFSQFANASGHSCPQLIHQTMSQIQKTVPGGHYGWHSDTDFRPVDRMRVITYLWYLNDVEDGYTEFCTGQRIYPERGKLILFPSTWDRIHTGTTPKTDKYICTGWMYSLKERM